jgi:MoaA/NifB/PqqE/SkfB family radical SAM enzyme
MDKQVDILIWLKCNQKCNFCFQEDESILSKDTIPDLWKILKTLIKWKNEWYTRVNIAWWEATIYNELYPTLKIARHLWYKQIKLITNAVRFRDFEYAKKIIPYLDDIAISFHSSDKDIQDNITKMQWSYDYLLEAISNIKKIKPNINLINHTVITQDNFNDLENHTKNLINLWFYRIDYLNMMPNTSLNKDLYVSPTVLSTKLINIIEKYKNDVRIEICYTQPCFYKWYEEYISGFDYWRDFLSNRDDVLLSWQQTLIDFKITKDKCNNCKYFEDCRGFWDEEKINNSK